MLLLSLWCAMWYTGGALRRIRARQAPLSACSGRQHLPHVATLAHSRSNHRLLQGARLRSPRRRRLLDPAQLPERLVARSVFGSVLFLVSQYLRKSKALGSPLPVSLTQPARGMRTIYLRRLPQMRCNKKGLVAPGSSEVITVDFHPREHRYHYDCLRLHTDSENLLVPLHAYPVGERRGATPWQGRMPFSGSGGVIRSTSSCFSELETSDLGEVILQETCGSYSYEMLELHCGVVIAETCLE